MVAPLIAAAGISAVGSLLGGLFGGSSAKKAAQIQQQTAREQIAAQQAAQQQVIGLNQPAITRGNEASDLYGGFLGMGDAANSARALETFRGATGYQDLMREGLAGVNSNAYARGMGDSGATLKALQSRGAQIANGSSQQWLGNLGTLVNAGTQAAGNISGVTQNTANNISGIAQNSANAQSNAALASGANWQNTLQNLANAGAAAYASSYGGQQPAAQNPYGVTAGPGMGGGGNSYWGGPNGTWAGYGVGGGGIY